jgi:hypothetical protein
MQPDQSPPPVIAAVPAEYSILRFTPDDRFVTVHFEGYRGDELVVSLTLPFIGWAVVVNWVQGGTYGPRLEAVGLSEHGEPVTAYLIGQNFALDEGKVIQTKLTPAEGSGVAESQPWPTELYPSS